jgi:hypothetical protein
MKIRPTTKPTASDISRAIVGFTEPLLVRAVHAIIAI